MNVQIVLHSQECIYVDVRSIPCAVVGHFILIFRCSVTLHNETKNLLNDNHFLKKLFSVLKVPYTKMIFLKICRNTVSVLRSYYCVGFTLVSGCAVDFHVNSLLYCCLRSNVLEIMIQNPFAILKRQ